MQVRPTTTVILLKNVPLDSDYEHTFYFDTALHQEIYFFSKKATYPNGNYMELTYQSYVRVSEGKIRVSGVADWYFSCNYLMFKNANYLNKWFYAFIKKINYINDNTTEIEFELDVMQSWLFDYELQDCMVEREHSATDVLFQERIPERLGLGTGYINVEATPTAFPSGTQMDLSCEPDNYAVLTKRILQVDPVSGDVTMVTPDGGYFGNIYTPLNVVLLDNLTALQNLIKQYVSRGYEDDIVDIYCYPSFLGTTLSPATQSYPARSVFRLGLFKGEPFPGQNPLMACGYEPRNKKLLGYPYNFLTISNNSGTVSEYKWEDFESLFGNADGTAEFELTGTYSPVASSLIAPHAHRGIFIDYDSSISITSFPKIAFQGDIYAAWQAQHSAQRATADVVALLGLGIQSAVGIEQLAGGDISGAGVLLNSGVQVASQFAIQNAQEKDMKKVPPQLHGQIGNEGVIAHLRRYRFTMYYTSIKRAQAEIIDEYFDKYGYLVNKLKKPNRNVRPFWTYCKTIGCAISGELPPDDAKKISSIYNNGITWWNLVSPNTDAIVGDYSLDNTVS